MVDVYKYVKETDTEEELHWKAYALYAGDGVKANTRAALAVCEYAELKGYDSCAKIKGHILFEDAILAEHEEQGLLKAEAMQAYSVAGEKGDLYAIERLMCYYVDPRDGDDLEKAIYWREKMREIVCGNDSH